MSTQIISSYELERIKKSVLPEDHNDFKARRKAELKMLSQDRLQHWPNTLEAARLKKESFIAEKKQKEEEARKEIDKIVRSRNLSLISLQLAHFLNLSQKNIKQ